MRSSVVVFGARHGKQVAGVAQPLIELLQCADDGLELLALAAQVLSALRIVPDSRILAELDDFGQTIAFGFEVKDTSAVLWSVSRGRQAGWPAR